MLAGVAGLAVAAGVSVSSDSGPSNPPDTTPPPNPRLALAADTGVLGTDAVTNVGVVNVSGLESGATWEYSTNGGGSWSAGSGSSFALSGDGAKTVIVRQTDAAGNSATSAALRFTLDTVTATPVVNLVATDDTVNSAEKLTGVIVKGTAEAEASVAVTWGSLTKVVTATSGAWSVNFSSADVPADATDSTISAVATDVAGNASAAGARVVTVDTLAPTTPVIGVVATDDIINAAERGATVTVTGTKEAGATVTLNGQATTVVDATSWSYVLDAAAIGAFGEGAQTLTAIATDAAGNVNATNGTRAITVDTVAPTVTITDDEAGVANIAGGSVTYTFTFSQAVTGFTVADVSVVGGTKAGAFATGTDGDTVYTLVVTPNANATVSMTVDVAAGAAVDISNNSSVAATQAVQAVDTLAPTVTITDDEAGVANIAGGSVIYTFTFSQAVTGFTVADVSVVGGTKAGAFATGTDGDTVYTLVVTPNANATASMTVNVAAGAAVDVSNNGNVAATQALQAVDTLAPTTPVIGVVATDDIINAAERSATVTVTGTKEAGATVTLNGQATTVVDATSWSYVLDAAAIGAFGEGAQTLTAIATDASGNVNATNGTRAITVDTVAPVISLLSATGATGTVVLTYDGPLDASNVALASNFTVTTADTVNPVTAVAVAGSVITLTVSAFTPGSITVAYADPTAGDDTAAIQDAAGNDAVGFSTGVVADGYVRGAMVYIDTNSNGIADPGLDYLVGSTNINGNFFLSTDAPVGTLIAVGGVNTDTGVPNTLSLKAPAGSTTINPLTTMIQAVVDTSPGISAAAAASRVASRLGLDLDEGVGLLHYDPIAATTSADPTISAVALSAQKLAAQVATMMTLASNAAAVLAGAANAYGAADVADQVVKSLADQISNAVTTDPVVQLADANTVHALLTIALLGTEVSAAQQALIQNAIVDASNAIGAAMDLGAITAAQSQALDDLPPAAPAIWVPGPSGGMTPSVQVHFDTTATDGSAVVAGDTVMLQDSGQPTGVTATLGIADIAAGFVTIAAPGLTGDGHLITAALVDRAGNVSAASALLPAHSETFAVLPAQAGLVALVGGSDNDYRDDVPLPKFEEVFHQPGETMIATDTMVNVEVQPFMVADTAIRQVDLDLAHRAIPQII
jgi:uncharacterized protein YuzE